jgi:hypothetical protein
MLCPAQSPNLHCSLLVAYTPYQEQKSKNHQRVMYLWLGQKRWRDPATAELLRHRLQRASYGANGSGPPVAVLLGGAPTAVGLNSGASGWGRRAGLGTGPSGRGSSGSGAQRRCRRARLWWQRGSALAVAWLLWHRRWGRWWWCRGRRWFRGRWQEIGQPDGAKSNFHYKLGFHVGGLLPFISEDYSYRLA